MSGARKLLIGLGVMVVIAASVVVAVKVVGGKNQPLSECIIGKWERSVDHGGGTRLETLTFSQDGTYSFFDWNADNSKFTESGEYKIVGDDVRQRPTKIVSASRVPQPSGNWSSGTHRMTCDGDTLTETFTITLPNGATDGYGPITFGRI
jgi:hypothetical protein